MTGPTITLYVDIVSPFAYFGFHILRNTETFKQCEVNFVPVFLGGIMKSTGNQPPLYIKNKDKFIEQDRKRWASIFSIPVADRAPDGFPVNTIAVQRALIAVYRDHPEKLSDAIAAFYKGFWVDRNEGDVTGAGLSKVLASVLGEGVTQEVMHATKSDEIKQLLNKTTQEAVDAGAFGLPYFVATNSQGEKQTYWGVDHLGMVIDHLGLDRSALGGKYKSLL